MSKTRRTYKTKKRRKWPWLLVLVLLLIVGAGVWGYSRLNRTTDAIYQPVSDGEVENIRSEEANVSDEDPISFLLLGVDHNSERLEENSDVMILVTVNPNTGKAKMVSIPRDTPIPGTESKMNSAYASNGISGAINAVQSLLNVPVDYYATVDMEGLIHIIDTIGGVTVENNFAFEQNGYQFPQGMVNIQSGDQALAFVRMRYDDPEGDFGRNRRQRALLLALLDKFSSPAIVTQVGPLFNTVENYVNTNLTASEMASLALNYRLDSSDVESLDLVGTTGTSSTGASMNYVSDQQIQEVSTSLRENLELE